MEPIKIERFAAGRWEVLIMADPRPSWKVLARRDRTVASVVLGAWVLLAVVMVVAIRWRSRNDRFDWTSSHAGVMARNFANEGIIALKGLPVQNNPPFGRTLDVYTHFPPLFFMILSKLGGGEGSIRLVMLAAHLATCGFLTLLALRAWGGIAGSLTALIFLTAPVSLKYANLVYWPYLNLALVAASVLSFVEASRSGRPSWRGWWVCLTLGVVSMSTSWELFFVHAFFLVAAIFRKRMGDCSGWPWLWW